MAAADKDLEGLRKEHKDLSDYTGRVAIIFLTILCLLVISFSRAWSRAHSEKVKDTLAKIHQAHGPFRESPYFCKIDVSYIFIGLELQTAQKYSAEEYVLPCKDNDEEKDRTSGPFALPLDPSLKKKFCDCQRQLEDDLEKSAISSFVVKAPIPGVNTEIDLRYWILSLPVTLCLGALYLYILRKKLVWLEITAVQRLREVKPEEVTQLDRLYFEGSSTYLNFPSKLTSFLFVFCYLFLPIYLIYIVCSVAWTYREYGGLITITTLLAAVLTCAFYAVAFGYSVGKQLDRQIIAIARSGTRTQLGLLPSRGKTLLEKLAQNVSPKVSLAIGSAMVLLSLFLPLSTNPYFRGYQLALAGSTGLGLPGYVLFLYAGFSRTIYLLTLLLAVVTIFLVIPPIYSLLNRRWIRAFVLGAGSCLFLTNVVAFTVSTIDDVVGFTPKCVMGIKVAALLITLALWLCILYSVWKGKGEQNGWKKLRSVALVVYAPIFLIPLQYLVPCGNLGLTVFFVGTGLLTLGFVQVQYRSGLVANSRSKN